MCRVPVVVTVSEGAAREMLALARAALVERIDALREGAIVSYQTARDLADVAAVGEFRLEALALVESDLAGLYRDLVDVVPPLEADDPGQAAAADEGG